MGENEVNRKNELTSVLNEIHRLLAEKNAETEGLKLLLLDYQLANFYVAYGRLTFEFPTEE
jgi:hypothetical protein